MTEISTWAFLWSDPIFRPCVQCIFSLNFTSDWIETNIPSLVRWTIRTYCIPVMYRYHSCLLGCYWVPNHAKQNCYSLMLTANWWSYRHAGFARLCEYWVKFIATVLSMSNGCLDLVSSHGLIWSGSLAKWHSSNN